MDHTTERRTRGFQSCFVAVTYSHFVRGLGFGTRPRTGSLGGRRLGRGRSRGCGGRGCRRRRGRVCGRWGRARGGRLLRNPWKAGGKRETGRQLDARGQGGGDLQAAGQWEWQLKGGRAAVAGDDDGARARRGAAAGPGSGAGAAGWFGSGRGARTRRGWSRVARRRVCVERSVGIQGLNGLSTRRHNARIGQRRDDRAIAIGSLISSVTDRAATAQHGQHQPRDQ